MYTNCLTDIQKGIKRKSDTDSGQLQKKQKVFFRDENEIGDKSKLKRKNPFDSSNQMKKKKVYFDMWN